MKLLGNIKLLSLKIFLFLCKPFSSKGYNNIFLARWIYEKLFKVIKPKRTIIKTNGYKMMIDYQMHGLGRRLIIDGEYEYLCTQQFKAIAKQRLGLIVDVGANIGYYTLLAAKILREKPSFSRFDRNYWVEAFEPEADNLSFLHHNIKINRFDNILVNQIGLSDTQKCGKLFISPTESGKHNIVGSQEFSHSQVVDLNSLDNIIGSRQLDMKVAIIKIDVEGAECRVLRGARQTINNWKPALFIECWEKGLNIAGDSINTLFGLFDEYGYSMIEAVDEYKKTLVKATPEYIRDYCQEHSTSVNLICHD